ncbi:hypothetical protein [uncultured Pelagimonas sp.]|uniref:hypothetical protein n=1 Tax=uncultured Pelagimonas sp. TaxID=1618102 RepID=UPI00260AF9A3|nr:hypothetical protein [uncultured Pelagimonas sp.]
MAEKYAEVSPNRVLAVLELAGDMTPFIAVGTGNNSHTKNDFAKGSYERRLDEIVRLSIRPVAIGGVITSVKPIRGINITGTYAEAAGIKNEKFDQNKRLELPQSGVIDASFEIVHKRRLDMTDAEAYQLQAYPELIYGGAQSIIDETEDQGGSGFYAVRMTDVNSGSYAVELLVDDFD